MDTNKNNQTSNGITFSDFLIEATNRRFIVITIVILSVVFSFFYTKIFATPKYTACAKMLIVTEIPADQQMNTSDFSVSSFLIRDYTEIMFDKVVLGRVAKELNIDLSVSQLRNTINIENPSESRVLEIYVTSKDPEQAQKIANKICSVSKEEIFIILNRDTINIMSIADTPKVPSSPNLVKNMMSGFIAGLILSAVVVVFFLVFDDTIKSKNDVSKHLGLEVLSVIPYVRSKGNSANSK